MMRELLKAGTAGFLHQTRLDRMFGRITGARKLPVILGYHRVVEDFSESAKTSIPSLLISREMLERHLDWVGKRYRFVDLDDLGNRLESGEGLESPLAAVTFDDGYSDFYQHAVPVLRKKGIPATVFVVTDLVGTLDSQLHDRLYFLLARRASTTAYQATRTLIETLPATALRQVIHTLEQEAEEDGQHLDSARSLNWEELERIRHEGFTVGSHTSSHIVLTNENHSRISSELSKSRTILEDRLGTPVRHFAYPGGSFNTTSIRAVAAAGYRFAYTGCAHRSETHPLLTMPRTVLWENSCLDSRQTFSGSVLSCQIHRAFDFVNGCRERHEAIS